MKRLFSSPDRFRPATVPPSARAAERGVALVITLILLAVITFMAVTLLVVSRRERERVGTTTTQNQATFAGKAGAEAAKAQILAQVLAHTNSYDSETFVSTNYQAPGGFRTGNSSLTNVGYNYANGAPLNNQGDLLRNLNNLLILPRAPVFVSTTNRSAYSDFRYYHDLNRNGLYETNGWAGVWVKGNLTGYSNFFLGDPEWIGLLDKPEQRHSSSNQFIGRYCYLVQPIGNLLDFNHIHNQSKQRGATVDGFLRNQGFGSWEINLATFLATLNTNLWGPNSGSGFNYRTNLANGSDGFAFQDSASILQFRYGGGYVNLYPVAAGGGAAPLFGPQAGYKFAHDSIDGYARGPIMGSIFPTGFDTDISSQPWSGANNVTNFFTTQDLLAAPTATSPGLTAFQGRLLSAGTNLNSYDRYTFYNLLAQAGVGSAPESPYEMGIGAAVGQPAVKLNLNYNNTAGLSATNFVEWTNAVQFFTNAANLLLTNAGYNFGVSHIPVLSNGTNFEYTPSIQRLLQLAVNIYDATTYRTFDNSTSNAYPTVLRPYFTVDNSTNIFITGFQEITNGSTFNSGEYTQIPVALPEQAGYLRQNFKNQTLYTNIYNVPWIIGAKKGFPNFNEFSMATVSQVTRKLQITKPKVGAARGTWQTNVAYVIGISNAIGVEAWNSYTNPYPRAVDLVAADNLVMALWYTNQPGQPGTLLAMTNIFLTSTNRPAAGIPPLTWTGIPPNASAAPAAVRASFQVPIMTNFLFLADSILHQRPPGLFRPGSNDLYEAVNTFTPVPHLVLAVTNRFRFIMRDVATGRIIDYVALNHLDTLRDLTSELSFGTDTLGVWNTNSLVANTPAGNGVTRGINNQILISSGAMTVSPNNWNNATLSQLDQTAITLETQQFRDFLNNGITNLAMQAAFTPTAKYSQYWSWQANDPLVHYTAGDLATVFAPTNTPILIQPPNSAATNNYLVNIQVINTRYQPWGGNPLKKDPQTAKIDMNLAFKDPFIRKSDDWRFPTNKFPTVGWLGRVHRGTPWQTVYLKSSGVSSNDWKTWTGNPNGVDAGLTQPTNDWRILDLFTVAQNENATRGQLSINQTNLAAWAAVLGGVVAVTNPNPSVSLYAPLATFTPYIIDPVGDYTAFTNIISAINDVRRTNMVVPNLLTPKNIVHPGVFTSLGQILAAPELTVNSPFLNLTGSQEQYGLCDEAYERIPQQILSLLKVGDPRYVIYAWGQSLQPAPGSVIQSSGPFFGMVTNYQITGEIATRSVIRIDHRPTLGTPLTGANQPRVVTESFTILPPEQ